MANFTIEDLIRVLRACAGEGEPVEAGVEIALLSFGDLGYDSLALLETASVIKREFGVDLPDDVVGELDTPGEFVATVNRKLDEVS
ncbi:acyl carrier protein [Saccharopolyspora phatthalungensis]|uniref:Act minimal PKS acyl carrier protein n=1 Tax=Saccharopolyspora phatthalungensis TaxID=664693 RepID=A0A840QGW3_9PSEU|nr:acyl carrier protein [Saccharopolyspora phatthalungensis]MBB5158008.1 act minimal PKS acyl carrier protein [Saccharopolyspora phatthalungensis]